MHEVPMRPKRSGVRDIALSLSLIVVFCYVYTQGIPGTIVILLCWVHRCAKKRLFKPPDV
jgi:hypothetical protein